MDRNIPSHWITSRTGVARPNGRGDMKIFGLGGSGSEVLSLSARRAWIEIFHLVASSHSVTSLSARRAWIEICVVKAAADIYLVALRKESVDRNRLQGSQRWREYTSLSARRAWIEI